MNDSNGPSTVVMGLGSPLMGDDGLGLAALAGLRSQWRFEPEIEWVDGGTWGMNLLPTIESAGRLLLLDAIRAGAEPGDLVVLQRHDLPRWLGLKLSPHQIDLKEVLALAELRGRLPEQTVAVGLEPAVVELGCELSPIVEANLHILVAAAVGGLEHWGHTATARAVGGDAGVFPPPAADVTAVG